MDKIRSLGHVVWSLCEARAQLCLALCLSCFRAGAKVSRKLETKTGGKKGGAEGAKTRLFPFRFFASVWPIFSVRPLERANWTVALRVASLEAAKSAARAKDNLLGSERASEREQINCGIGSGAHLHLALASDCNLFSRLLQPNGRRWKKCGGKIRYARAEERERESWRGRMQKFARRIAAKCYLGPASKVGEQELKLAKVAHLSLPTFFARAPSFLPFPPPLSLVASKF